MRYLRTAFEGNSIMKFDFVLKYKPWGTYPQNPHPNPLTHKPILLRCRNGGRLYFPSPLAAGLPPLQRQKVGFVLSVHKPFINGSKGEAQPPAVAVG
jgi:hypothetical protein